MWAIKERLLKDRLDKTWEPADMSGGSGKGGLDQKETQKSLAFFLVLFSF